VPWASAVLTAIAVSSEEERVGDLPTKPPWHVDVAHEPDDNGSIEAGPFGAEGTGGIHLERFGLPVDDQTNSAPDRYDRQRLIRRVQRETTHVISALLADRGV
jgi:hypothetical protein